MTRASIHLALPLALASLVGCSSEEAPSTEPVLGSFAGTPRPPAPPEPPSFESCPDGLRESGDRCVPESEPAFPRSASTCPEGWTTEERPATADGLVIDLCYPTLPTGRCGDGQRVDFATGTCVAIGSCEGFPAATVPGAPAMTPDVYVSAGAAGNGTISSPFGSLSEALGAAPDGGVILVGPGIYQGAYDIVGSVTIVGSCVGDVIFEGPEPTMTSVLDDPTTLRGTFTVEEGANLGLRNLTIRGKRVGLRLLPGATVDAASVRFFEATDKAIANSGGSLTLEDAIVEATAARIDGSLGRGLQVDEGGSATVSATTFQDNDRTEIATFGEETTLILRDVLLQDAQPEEDPPEGPNGLGVYDGSTVTAERLALRRKSLRGITVEQGSTFTLRRGLVAEIRETRVGDIGAGIAVFDSRATISDLTLIGASGHGLFLRDDIPGEHDTVVTVEDSVILGAEGRESDGEFGRGIAAFDSTQLKLSRVLVGASEETGILVGGGRLEANDLVLIENDFYGLLNVEGTVTIVRGLSAYDQIVGISTSRGTLELTDVLVRNTRENQDRGGPDLGIGVFSGQSTVRMKRVAVNDADRSSMLLAERTDFELEALAMGGSKGGGTSDEWGYGFSVAESQGTVRGLAIRDHAGVGIIVDDRTDSGVYVPSSIVLSDVRVTDSVPHEPSSAGGFGVGVVGSADVTFERTEVERSVFAGMAFLAGARTRLTDVAVRDTVADAADMGGFGVSFAEASQGVLERLLIERTQSTALGLTGVGTSVVGEDVDINEVAPAGDFNGMGILTILGARTDLERARVAGSHGAGILVQFSASFSGKDIIVDAVQTGTFPTSDFFGSDDVELGDCILALSRSKLELERAGLTACARVGVLFDDAEGALVDVRVASSPRGIALQGFPTPEVTWRRVAASGFEGLILNGDLRVPESAPPALDSSSSFGNLVRQ